MYLCEFHGYQKTDVCSSCGVLLECACTDLCTTSYKKITFELSESKEELRKHSILYLAARYCETCGTVKEYIQGAKEDSDNQK